MSDAGSAIPFDAVVQVYLVKPIHPLKSDQPIQLLAQRGGQEQGKQFRDAAAKVMSMRVSAASIIRMRRL